MTKDQGQIISQTPGRIRLRLPASTRESGGVESLTNLLKKKPGITRIRSNPDTGSLTIFYSEDTLSFPQLSDILGECGLLLTTPEVESTQEITTGSFSEAATEITAAVAALNQRVNRVTDGAADLRFLVPLGFGTLALRQLLLKGIQLDIIPWYVFAWYAFDSFIKLHYTKLPDAPDRENKSPD
ncbi:HMA2 domain-containing protein [[Phormidium] sp. ETS-05]|uniref:HMA2 domain-containing protein n=1 Tax=[Phormidium] sp. ETS-05 TaxID=222819 RepID=UPI0018EF3178|nr:hypothetical protein [[Phormidium] sp. ETS-05]